MSVDSSYRRTASAAAGAVLAVGVVVAAAVGAPPASVAAVAPSGELRAVVSMANADARLPGVRVLASFPAVSAALVSGSPGAVTALGRAPGVRGVAPDGPLRVTGTAPSTDTAPAAGTTSTGRGVMSWEGLGDPAGEPAAGAGVGVAVVDTGVSDNAVLNRASGRLVDGVDTSRLSDGGGVRVLGRFEDGHGHGTFMASLVAGGTSPGGGGRSVGVAPGARVVVVKVATTRARPRWRRWSQASTGSRRTAGTSGSRTSRWPRPARSRRTARTP